MIAITFGNIPEGISDALVVLIILFFVFGSKTIRSLLVHQQKMAEIIHRNQNLGLTASQGSSQDLESLRQDVELLKATVNQQTTLLDTIARQQKQILDSAARPNPIEERLGAQNER